MPLCEDMSDKISPASELRELEGGDKTERQRHAPKSAEELTPKEKLEQRRRRALEATTLDELLSATKLKVIKSPLEKMGLKTLEDLLDSEELSESFLKSGGVEFIFARKLIRVIKKKRQARKEKIGSTQVSPANAKPADELNPMEQLEQRASQDNLIKANEANAK